MDKSIEEMNIEELLDEYWYARKNYESVKEAETNYKFEYNNPKRVKEAFLKMTEYIDEVKRRCEKSEFESNSALSLKRGHWEGDNYPRCSECGRLAPSQKENIRVVDDFYDFDGICHFYKTVNYDIVYDKTIYCPYCGAKLKDE